jgi:hypothetical protein
LAIGNLSFNAKFLVVNRQSREISKYLVLIYSSEVLGFFLEIILVELLRLKNRVIITLYTLVERVRKTAGGFFNWKTGLLVY